MQSILPAATSVALLLFHAVGSLAVSLPRSFVFDCPPYSSIANGLPVHERDALWTSLLYSPGEAEVIFVYGQETNAACSTNSISASVEDARGSELIRADYLRASVVYAEARHDILRFTNGAVVPIAGGDVSIAERSVVSAIHTEKSTNSVVISRQSGGLRSAKHSTDLSRPYQDSGAFTTAETDSQIIVQRSAGDMQGASGEGAVEKSQTSRALHSRSDETQMQRPVRTSVNALMFGEEGVAEILRDRQAGGIGVLDESHTVGILSDSDFIRMLIDANLIDGFYDSDNILMKAGLEVPPEEISAFLDVLSKGGPLSEMLDRAFSKSLRVEGGRTTEDIIAELSIGVIGGSVHHHGSRLMFTVSVTNRGLLPMHDALVFNALPDHTTFDGFPVAHAERHGVVQTFLKNRNQVVWKLYRPLQPGETFRTSYTVILDSWRIPFSASSQPVGLQFLCQR